MRTKRSVKLIALMLAAMMLVPAISGCTGRGGGTETSDGDAAQSTDTNTPETEPDAPVTGGSGYTGDPGVIPTVDDWNGVAIKSSGKSDENAILNGRGLSVLFDDAEGKNVLSIEEGGGYLALPVQTWGDADGITAALRVYLSTGCAANAKVFQTNLCGNGVGDTQWHDAPEISISADGEVRIYAGGRTINGTYNPIATYNNGGAGDDKAYAEPNGHKTRYSGRTKSALPKEEWIDLVLTLSPAEAALYINGEKAALRDATEGGGGDVSSTLEYLFGTFDGGENLIGQYINTSVGGSVYTDTSDFVGSVSMLRIYRRALSEDEIKSLPEADLVYDFDGGDILTDTEAPEASSDLTHYKGGSELSELSELAVESPNGTNKVRFWTDAEKRLYYSVEAGGTVVIESSALGITAKEGGLESGLALAADSVAVREINETYKTVTGPAAEAVNNCREERFTLKNGSGSFDFVIRVFDDGVAYKYENVTAGDGDTVTVTDEASEYVLPATTKTWGYAPTGTYEGEYVERTYAQLAALSLKMSTPMLANRGEYWMVFTEAGVYNNNGDFCASALTTDAGDGSLGWSFGVDRDSNDKSKLGELGRPGHFDIKQITTRNGFSTPWRVAIISNDTGKLALSTIVTDLNPDPDPALYADTSYIKPGRVAWSWWAEEGEQGNYDKHKEYVDFAAENGWEYVCLDANWRQFEPRLGELCKYANEKGVGIFVWINYLDRVDDAEMEALFSAWSEAGVAGLKTDYFESDAQNVLEVMRKAAECAAKHKLMILFHGCVIPCGEARTYPNVLTTEAVQGEENHKWSAVPTVTNCLLYPFVRNVCGSMDYTPVASRIGVNGSSAAFGLAMTVVYESGLQHLANAASVYKTYAGLPFLNNLAVKWDESVMIDGVPGEYVCMARRAGDDWYVGAMTKYAANVDVKLDFLGDGEYNAYIFRDNEDGSGLIVEERKVTSKDSLSDPMVDGGGFAAIITKRTIETTVAGAEEYNDPDFTYYEAESGANKLSGAAVLQTSAFCSGMQKVGYVGNGANNTLTFNGITVDKDGEYTLRLWFCCGENRTVKLNVNGVEYEMTGLNSGDYVHTAMAEIKISLAAGENSITFSNPSYYAPDIDRIAISKTAE